MGCSSNQGYVGTYAFQLGANEGTHTSISLTLTNEAYPTEDPTLQANNPKKFKLAFDINGLNSDTLFPSSESEPTSEPSSEQTSETSSEQTSEEQDDSEIPFGDLSMFEGYYYTLGEQEKTGELLHLGIKLLNLVDISPIITEKILYATVNNSEINVTVPVSLKDLYYQLYWYGYRVGSLIEAMEPVNLYEEDPLFESVLAGNKPGTHPSKEAISSIAKYQKNRTATKPENYLETEMIFDTYHDFHTLNMGLKKNA